MNRNDKNVVRLTESQLRGMIKEAVKNVINEESNNLKPIQEIGKWLDANQYEPNGNQMCVLACTSGSHEYLSFRLAEYIGNGKYVDVNTDEELHYPIAFLLLPPSTGAYSIFRDYVSKTFA